MSALADLSAIGESEKEKEKKGNKEKENKKRKGAEETDDSDSDSSEEESEEGATPRIWDAHNKKKKFMKMAKEVNAF